MYPYRRLALTITHALRAGRLGLTEEATLPLRVALSDLDTNGHVNNGRFLTLMDLGRLDLVARVGMVPLVARRRALPMVALAMIRFRRELRAFDTFELRTRILGWDQKWFWIQQEFWKGDKVLANGLVKGLFRGPAGNVAPDDLTAELGFSHSPPLPAVVAATATAERLLLQGEAPALEEGASTTR